MNRPIKRTFFRRDPLRCARELVGCEIGVGECRARIVETEAYSVRDDPACHTFHRPSSRAFVAEHEAGCLYVYLNYGMYWLLNFLVKGGDEDGFVLVRAGEPLAGIEIMQRRRVRENLHQLCSGPGKLTRALGIGGEAHGLDIFSHPDWRLTRPPQLPEAVTTPRIGISKAIDHPWRFVLKGTTFASCRGNRSYRAITQAREEPAGG